MNRRTLALVAALLYPLLSSCGSTKHSAVGTASPIVTAAPGGSGGVVPITSTTTPPEVLSYQDQQGYSFAITVTRPPTQLNVDTLTPPPGEADINMGDWAYSVRNTTPNRNATSPEVRMAALISFPSSMCSNSTSGYCFSADGITYETIIDSASGGVSLGVGQTKTLDVPHSDLIKTYDEAAASNPFYWRIEVGNMYSQWHASSGDVPPAVLRAYPTTGS